jgi:fermentation-respiration switch protein FrsA (DUF1100 family)
VKALAEGGRGVALVSYRGYAGSSGSPSEEGLALDAQAVYAFANQNAPNNPLIIYGESLGTGVAVRLAVEQESKGLILDAPFTSAADVARMQYPYVPIGWLMKDPFDSNSRISRLKVPLLILHGDADQTVPYHFGQQLFIAAPEPKRFVTMSGVNHSSAINSGGIDAIREFVAAREAGS